MAFLLLIPVFVFGAAFLWGWHDCRKQNKLEANPMKMNEIEYRRFNYKRCSSNRSDSE